MPRSSFKKRSVLSYNNATKTKLKMIENDPTTVPENSQAVYKVNVHSGNLASGDCSLKFPGPV